MKTFFVSSTFKDMHNERDLMHKSIIPDLNEDAFQYGESVAIRDLRWGVNTAEEKNVLEANKKVLNVCLGEIDACDHCVIVLLGDRYGFEPEEQVVSDVLAERNALSWNHPVKDISITELEIRYGAWKQTESDPTPKMLIYMRELQGEDIPPEYQVDTESEKKEKMSRLKAYVKTLAQNSNKNIIVRNYRVNLKRDGLKEFSEMMKEDLTEMLKPEWEKLWTMTDFQREHRRHKAFADLKIQKFVKQETVVNRIKEKLQEEGKNFLAIQGESGSGKSALMAYLSAEWRKQNAHVLSLFCGYTPLTCQGLDIIKRIVEFMEEILEEHDPSRSSQTWNETEDWDLWRMRMEELAEQYHKMKKESTSKMVILIDAIDQLSHDETRDNLLFVPWNNLSRDIQVVVSCTDQIDMRLWKESVIELEPLENEKEKKEILRGMFRALGKEIATEVETQIVKKQGTDNPLYLSLVVQRLAMMEKEDFQKLEAVSDYEKELGDYQIRILENCPDGLELMCNHILKEAAERIRTENDSQTGSEFVRTVIAYLSASRYGLRETDLEEMIRKGGKEEWNSLLFSQFYRYLRSLFIVREDGRYDFSHLSIRKAVYSKQDEKQIHKVIADCLKGLSEQDPVRMSELLYHCFKADEKEVFWKYLCEVQEKEERLLEAAIRGTYEICRIKEGNEWFCAILKACRPWEDSGRAESLLTFIYQYLDTAFGKSPEELELQRTLYTSGLELAQKLRNELDDEKGMRLLASACYYLGTVCYRLGGRKNYIQALELYLRERELVISLGGEDIGERSAESFLHLGIIYEALGGREKRNRALRMYGKSRELLEQVEEGKRTLEQQEQLRICVQRIGGIYAQGNERQQNAADSLYKEAIEIVRSHFPTSIEKTKILLCLYTERGDAALQRGDWTQAVRYYKDAESSAKSIKDKPPLEENQYNWLACRERSFFTSAMGGESGASADKVKSEYQDYYKKLKNLTQNRNSLAFKRTEMVFQEHEAAILLCGQVKQEQEAKEQLEKALKSFEEDADSYNCARDRFVILCQLGDCCRCGGEEKMLSYYKQAEELAERLNKENRTLQSRSDRMKIKEKIGDALSLQADNEALKIVAIEYYFSALEEAISLEQEMKSGKNRQTIDSLLQKIGGAECENKTIKFDLYCNYSRMES